MRQDLIASQTITISNSLANVWEGLTNPAYIKEYLYGTQTITDWKPGSEVLFKGDYNGTIYCDKGVVIENKHLETISYTYWSGFSGVADVPENYSLVTYKVLPISNNETALTWTMQGFATEEGYNHSQTGMSVFLKTVKDVMEKI